MLDLEITPEKSISSEKWQIILGMSFYQVIQILKTNCETIKSVQLIYNDKVHFIFDRFILFISKLKFTMKIGTVEFWLHVAFDKWWHHFVFRLEQSTAQVNRSERFEKAQIEILVSIFLLFDYLLMKMSLKIEWTLFKWKLFQQHANCAAHIWTNYWDIRHNIARKYEKHLLLLFLQIFN